MLGGMLLAILAVGGPIYKAMYAYSDPKLKTEIKETAAPARLLLSLPLDILP